MIPKFPRINAALRFTIEFFELARVIPYLQLFAGDTNKRYIETYYDIAIQCHGHMEDEIGQNIYGSNRNIQVTMFDFLKEWLECDRRLKYDFKETIDLLVEQYNSDEWEEYAKKIAADEEVYRAGGVYNRKHREEYLRTYPAGFSMLGFYVPERKETITNSWFYCNEKKPEIVDTSYLPKYYEMLGELVASFRRHSEPYVKKYLEGKIVPLSEIPLERGKLNQDSQKLLEETNTGKKIRMNLSVPQLAYLVRLLYDSDMFDEKIKAELCRLIINHFSTKVADDIGEKSFKNNFDNPEKDTAMWWAKQLSEMTKRSRNL